MANAYGSRSNLRPTGNCGQGGMQFYVYIHKEGIVHDFRKLCEAALHCHELDGNIVGIIWEKHFFKADEATCEAVDAVDGIAVGLGFEIHGMWMDGLLYDSYNPPQQLVPIRKLLMDPANHIFIYAMSVRVGPDCYRDALE